MNVTWKDIVTTGLAIVGGVMVFAKIQNYNWTFLSTWKSAFVTLGILGLLMLAINASELLDVDNWVNWGESVLWVIAAALVAIGLFTSSHVMYYSAAALLAVLWLAMLARHSWHATHTRTYVASH